MIKVAVTDVEYDKAVDVFENFNKFRCLRAPIHEAELSEFIISNDISHVIVGVEKYSGALYDALPKGGLIARFGVGHDGIDKELASEKGLLCSNTPGVLDNSVAECAVGLMLASARNLAACITDNKNGVWKNRIGAELAGKTIAIIGCGNIGRKVARIVNLGFGMKVIGYDVTAVDDDVFDEFNFDFAKVVSDADFVSIHLPSIPATNNFINMERLKLMSPSAIVVNTARGGVLDENDLYDAVKSGLIAGAALDVVKSEPYIPQSPDKDLRDLENVIMTPHVGSSTVEACQRMAEAAMQNIVCVINKEFDKVALLNPVC